MSCFRGSLVSYKITQFSQRFLCFSTFVQYQLSISFLLFSVYYVCSEKKHFVLKKLHIVTHFEWVKILSVTFLSYLKCLQIIKTVGLLLGVVLMLIKLDSLSTKWVLLLDYNFYEKLQSCWTWRPLRNAIRTIGIMLPCLICLDICRKENF